jgi:hypothetical protein
MTTNGTIDRLIQFDARGLPVVSTYVGLDVDVRDRASFASHVRSLLHEIRPLTEDSSLSREARLSLRGDIERIAEHLGEEREPPGTVALFSCSGADLFEEVRLPRPVRDRVVVDATPWVRPMLAVLDEYHRACVVGVEKKRARIWELYLGDLREVAEVTDRALRKPDYAGWYGLDEYRVRNKADNLTRRHFRRVASSC